MSATSTWLRGGLSAFAIAAVTGSAFADGAKPASPGLQVGGMVVVSPRYEGSADYRVTGVPMIAPAGTGAFGNGAVQFAGVDDLRFRLFQSGGFEAGPLVGWRFGREEDDGRRLRGLGDIDGGLVAGGYVAYSMGRFKPFLSYHHQVTGDETGGVLRFGSEARLPSMHGVSVTATLGGSYASGDYMASYFSVTPAQSAASLAGLSVYDAGAGMKDVYLGLSATAPLSDKWTLRLNGRYTRLLDKAADSPIVESENQFSAGAGLTYRFDLGR
jgi:MipA family protein